MSHKNIIIRALDTVSADDLPATWHVPPCNQGQIVTVSYGSDGGQGYRRTFDASDRTTSYAVCDLSDCGCEGECDCWEPWNREPSKFTWTSVIVEGETSKDDVGIWEVVATYVSDTGDGACDVRVEVGSAGDAWYIRTDDDAGGSDDCDDTAYASRRDAVMAAEEYAAENDEGIGGEDAEGYTTRRLEETRGTPDPKGEWCCYWFAGEDSGPRERYATFDQAEAAAVLSNAQLEAANSRPFLCGFEVRQLVGGVWVAVDSE